VTGRERALAAALVLGLAAVGVAQLPWGTWLHQADPTEPTVVFVVLDTVRADRLSLCGYDHPTSPTLQGLVDQGATFSCDAYAPGSWTLPSHASYFTGLEVPEHGAHFTGAGTVIRAATIRPLEPDLPVLAERFTERGYQTVGVSGNPVLDPASGLTRGFGSWHSPTQFGPLYGQALVDQVTASLRDADPDQPLFLFVNIADAHDPWDGVPRGLDWLAPRDDLLAFFQTDGPGGPIDTQGPWQQYVRAELSPADEAALLARVSDLYDAALWEADQTLGAVLDVVRDHNWDAAGLRVVIVSDHGEFLGEHRLLRHGRYLYEENARVPLVVLDSSGAPELPSPVAGLEAYDLALNGVLGHRPVRAAAFPDKVWMEQSAGLAGASTSAAIWTAEGKQLWMDGSLRDEGDPLDASPTLEMQVLVDHVTASRDRDQAMSPELEAALRAAGYLE
jgi:hypothetical protein